MKRGFKQLRSGFSAAKVVDFNRMKSEFYRLRSGFLAFRGVDFNSLGSRFEQQGEWI